MTISRCVSLPEAVDARGCSFDLSKALAKGFGFEGEVVGRDGCESNTRLCLTNNRLLLGS
jgi:hypothetical protein